jgi:hypothetical protein
MQKKQEKKGKSEKQPGDFSQGRKALVAVMCWDFPGCQVQLKAVAMLGIFLYSYPQLN